VATLPCSRTSSAPARMANRGGVRASAVWCCWLISPVMLSPVAGRLRSGTQPVDRDRRVGWRGETLWMFKLRTMWRGEGEPPAGEAGGAGYIGMRERGTKRLHDPRVTDWLAGFCRKIRSMNAALWHMIRGRWR